MDIDALTRLIIGAAFAVHNKLGTGFLEKVYENALRIELLKLGLDVGQQVPIKVHYENQIVGEFFADLFVDNRLIIEIKAVQNFTKEHGVQLVNYLTATGIEHGLLVNFGKSVEIQRKYRVYRSKPSTTA